MENIAKDNDMENIAKEKGKTWKRRSTALF